MATALYAAKPFLLLLFSVTVLVAAGAALPADSVTITASNSTTHSPTTIERTISDGMTFNDTVNRTQIFGLDDFSGRVIGYCIPAAVGIFFGAYRALGEKRSLKAKLPVATLAAISGVVIILIIIGPASQIVIPFLRSLSTGSLEQGVLLAAVLGICLIGIFVLLRRPAKELRQDTGGTRVDIIGDSNTVVIGDVDIVGDPSIQQVPTLKVSNLTAEPRILVEGPLTVKGQVVDQHGTPAINVLVQIFVYGKRQWVPYGTGVRTGSDGYFAAPVQAVSPPVAFRPLILEFADVKLVGDDFTVDRSNAWTKNLGATMMLAFQNSGNVMTTLLPIDWQPELFPDLKIQLCFPSQTPRDVLPNQLIHLKPSITLQSDKGVGNALESHGGSATITIKYAFTAPGGEQNKKEEKLRVVLTSADQGVAKTSG